MKPILLALLFLFTACQSSLAAAQIPDSSASQKPISVDLVKDFTKLLDRHYSSPKELQRTADQLAKHYAGALQKIKREVKDLVALVTDKIDEQGLQQRLNLALELWRVRASLDLLALTNPDTLRDLTGLTLPDLTHLRKQVQDLKPW